ncbi:MAG: succinate dehydrogenase, cytochrome b556 subunit [Wenzhouxiangella sp.]
MATNKRPLSPHLQIYRPQLTSVLSISHRFAGVILSAGLVMIVAWLLALASGPDAYERLSAVVFSWPGLLILLVWMQALFYHLLNGIRHLLWDAGWMLDLNKAYASGWTVVAVSVALSLLVWSRFL